MTADPPSSNPKSEIPNPKSPSDRSLLADLLKFLGLMLTVGGSLSIIRTHGVEDRWFSGPQLFFTLLIPIGLGVWATGFFLRRPLGTHASGEDDAHG